MGKTGRGDGKDKKLERLLKSMQTLLGSLPNEGVCACSISVVPDQLRKSNENAYTPKVVSIGPRYRGARRDLQYMEEIKWHCMMSLLCRTDDANESLKKCSEVILNLDEVVRASYVGDIKLDSYELARIMLCDGCFLLELLITGSDEWNDRLKSRLYPPGPGAKVGKMEEVLSDLTLFENQIPLFILHWLSTLLFPNVFTEFGHVNTVPIIHQLALSLSGYSWDSNPSVSNPYASHFLELVHFSIPWKGKKVEQSQHISIDIKSEQVEKRIPIELKLKRCATRLQAAGVSIKPTDKPAGNVSSFDFDMRFRNGKLEIPPLNITETTKAKWWSFIAWEHQRQNWKSSSTTGLSLKFTSSALVFNGLICCAADVQLLKDRKVIVDHSKMSNKELMIFFQTISMGVDHSIVDSSYIELCDDLNKYSAVNYPIQIPIILWHYIRCFLEWLFKFFKRDYNLVATVIPILTIAQTIFAVLSYLNDKK